MFVCVWGSPFTVIHGYEQELQEDDGILSFRTFLCGRYGKRNCFHAGGRWFVLLTVGYSCPDRSKHGKSMMYLMQRANQCMDHGAGKLMCAFAREVTTALKIIIEYVTWVCNIVSESTSVKNKIIWKTESLCWSLMLLWTLLVSNCIENKSHDCWGGRVV